MENLTVVHKKGRIQRVKGFPLDWETCVRHIAFYEHDGDQVRVEEGCQVYQGAEAYLFVLEVICGLHSPLVGETEIFGQFKDFVDSEKTRSSMWFLRHRQWFERLVSDAKSVRQKYLIGLGSQSYGSLVRRYCKGEDAIDIVGNGRLVEDILPWLKQSAATVLARNAEKNTQLQKQFSNLEFLPLDQLTNRQGVLVVAVPVLARQIEKWLESNRYGLVLDLRGESVQDPVVTSLPVVKLQQMFAEIHQNRDRIKTQISDAKQLALSLSQKYANQMQVRPFGWDDLCVYQ